jgi:hypothetical protein
LEFLRSVENLGFFEIPDYNKLRSLLECSILQIDDTPDNIYDWSFDQEKFDFDKSLEYSDSMTLSHHFSNLKPLSYNEMSLDKIQQNSIVKNIN